MANRVTGLKSEQRQPVWRRRAMACGTGLLLAASYPALGWWWLALVAYGPLLGALGGVKKVREGWWLGLLAGTVLHGLSFHWLSFTMREMSGLPTVVGWMVVGLHAVAAGVHQAVFGAGLVLSRQWRQRWWWPLWVGALLVMVEWLVPWQFPWYLGNTLYRGTWLMQAADVIGVVGLSGLIVAFTAALVRVVTDRSRVAAVVAATLLLVWVGYGGAREAMVESAPVVRTWSVGIVQHNPSLAEKKSERPGPRLPMLKRAIKLTKELPLEELDLVVWPEGTLPFFYVPMEVDKPGRAPPVLRKMTAEVQKLARNLGRPLVFGSLRRSDRAWKIRAKNAAIVLDGESEQTYDKHLLVPFGEYLPGRDWFPKLKDVIAGVSDLGQGEGPSVLTVRGVKVGLSICYEALFPGFMWRQSRDADLLLNLTDDVWFGPTNAPELHLMVQQARAVELRRPLVRVTATGISALVDASGYISGRTPVWRQATRVVRVEMRDVDAPFRWWGPWPARLISLGVLAGLALAWRRRNEVVVVV